jgi:hypothetical protein
MTTFGRKTIHCAVCGRLNEIIFLNSINEFGPRDLDGRPSEMKRATMSTWVEFCGNCGYASEDITEKLNVTPTIIATEEYQKLLKDQSLPSLAKKFLCNGCILEKTGQKKKHYTMFCMPLGIATTTIMMFKRKNAGTRRWI